MSAVTYMYSYVTAYMYVTRTRMHMTIPVPILDRNTVEPPNKGHFENGPFVLCSEVVPILEVQLYYPQTMF